MHNIHGFSDISYLRRKIVFLIIHYARKAKNRLQYLGIIQVEAPIDASNVMLLDPKVNKPTRVSIIVENGKKIRVSKKSDHKFN